MPFGDDALFCACITNAGTAPPFHHLGGVRSLLTHDWPRLGWLHIASLVWGLAVEVLPWPCPLTLAENWLQGKAGLIPYQGGFLLYYLDALVYPNVSPRALTAGGVVIWLVNLAIYTVRFRPRHSAGR